MVAKLHGDFAFVLHDSRLVRNGLHTKPCIFPTRSSCQCLSADLRAFKHLSLSLIMANLRTSRAAGLCRTSGDNGGHFTGR